MREESAGLDDERAGGGSDCLAGPGFLVDEYLTRMTSGLDAPSFVLELSGQCDSGVSRLQLAEKKAHF